MKNEPISLQRRPNGERPVQRPQPSTDPDWEWGRGIPPPGSEADSGKPTRWQATLAMLALVMILAGVATLLIVEIWLSDRVMPGVYVWDVDLGGLTPGEAAKRLQAEFHYPSDRNLTLRYGEQSWPLEPSTLGTQLDVAATANVALSVGHRGDLLTRAREQIDVLLNGTLVIPSFSFDAGTSAMFLSRVAGQMNRPLRNASLSLADDLTVVIMPGQMGIELDEDATRQALVQRVSEMTGGEVQAIVGQSVPLLADLSATQAQVQGILSGPVVLTAPGFDSWTIEPRTLASWLILRPVTPDNGPATLEVSLDLNLVNQFTEALASQIERPPVDAQFQWDDARGGLIAAEQSVPGQMLDVTSTVELIDAAALSNERTVALPVTSIRPALASEDAPGLGIVELIAEGTTGFAGSSSSRVQNIVVGAAQFNGILIAPDEVFSFNHYLGEVTAEKGYEESIIIWGNSTRADVGGGLCQVSSTAFRAAFWAGVPFIERWPHAFRVSYYEPPKGMDATIYSPSVDLKWQNDTGHHILIHTYVDTINGTLTFRFYGTKPARTVEMDGPHESNPVPHGPDVYRDDPTLPKGQTKQIEWAKDGLDVTVYRIIKEDGIEIRRDSIFSRYQPWEAVYLRGTQEP